MKRHRIVRRPCDECKRHFECREIYCAFDCNGKPAVDGQPRRGIWYGYDAEEDEDMRLELPRMAWKPASGLVPVCDNCSQFKEETNE